MSYLSSTQVLEAVIVNNIKLAFHKTLIEYEVLSNPAGNFSSVYDWPLMAMFGIADVKQRCSTATFQTYIVGIIDGICPLFPTMILAVFDR